MNTEIFCYGIEFLGECCHQDNVSVDIRQRCQFPGRRDDVWMAGGPLDLDVFVHQASIGENEVFGDARQVAESERFRVCRKVDIARIRVLFVGRI